MSTHAERLAAMEVEVRELKATVAEMNSKLDELLTLKDKGAGAFWLASLVVGTGVMGFVFQVINWFRS